MLLLHLQLLLQFSYTYNKNTSRRAAGYQALVDLPSDPYLCAVSLLYLLSDRSRLLDLPLSQIIRQPHTYEGHSYVPTYFFACITD